MKNSAVFFSVMILGAFLLIASDVISFSTGAPTNASGSPSNNNMTCVQCHASNVNQRLGWITSTELSQGYSPGVQYNMRAKAAQAGCSKFGFLITIEKADGTKAGVPVATDGTRTQIQNTHYITHTSAGTQGQDSAVWEFKWTAPAAMGWVTFYGAFLGANGNNQNTGDVVYVSKKDVFLFGTQGIAHESAGKTNRLFLYPNPATDHVQLKLADETGAALLRIFDLTGRKVREISWDHPNLMMVDVSSLPEGVYLMHLLWEGDQATAKVVVRR